MGIKFKNSEEARKVLLKNGWTIKRTTKHYIMMHPDFVGTLSVPRKDKYISPDVEQSILKALKETGGEV